MEDGIMLARDTLNSIAHIDDLAQKIITFSIFISMVQNIAPIMMTHPDFKSAAILLSKDYLNLTYSLEGCEQARERLEAFINAN